MSRPGFDPDAAAAPGSGVFGLDTPVDESAAVLVPVPFDATVSYRPGAADGPAAILAASRQVDLFDLEMGRPYEAGIAMEPESPEVRVWSEEARRAAEPVLAAGGAEAPDCPAELRRAVARVDERAARMVSWVRGRVSRLLDQGRLPCVVGGEHGAALGAIQACAERHPGLGVLQLDAHADLRQAFEGFGHSHASVMYNALRSEGVARLVQVGVRDVGGREVGAIRGSGGRIVCHFDSELWRARFDGRPWQQQVERIVADLPQQVYLSFDIDGLDPSLCPHTGTPVPGGLAFAEVGALLAGVVRAGRTVVGLDLCEVAPGPSGDDWDANVGARLLYKMIGFSLLSRNR